MPEPLRRSSRHTTSAGAPLADDSVANAAPTPASRGTASRGRGRPRTTNAGRGANSRSAQGTVRAQVVQARVCFLIVLDEL